MTTTTKLFHIGAFGIIFAGIIADIENVSTLEWASFRSIVFRFELWYQFFDISMSVNWNKLSRK